MKIRLITKTVGLHEYEGKSIDEIITGIARLSSSREINELFDEPHKLLRHCLLNQHWSVFSTVNMGFEIQTSRAMGREILRHKSADFQEFSQRYSATTQFEEIEIRKQSTNNRQSSTDVFNPDILEYPMFPGTDDDSTYPISATEALDKHLDETKRLYNDLLKAGVARECARFILGENASTSIYMNANIRTFVSFLNQRLHKTAQKECRLVAEEIRDIFIGECPIISAMLYNFEDAYDIHILERIVLEKYGVYQSIKDNNFKKLK